MIGDSGSLYWVLWDMGFNAHQCRHIVTVLGRLRLCNLGPEEWNTVFRKWRDKCVMTGTSSLRKQVHAMLGSCSSYSSTFEPRQLFDADEEADVRTTPPGRPRG